MQTSSRASFTPSARYPAQCINYNPRWCVNARKRFLLSAVTGSHYFLAGLTYNRHWQHESEGVRNVYDTDPAFEPLTEEAMLINPVASHDRVRCLQDKVRFPENRSSSMRS